MVLQENLDVLQQKSICTNVFSQFDQGSLISWSILPWLQKAAGTLNVSETSYSHPSTWPWAIKRSLKMQKIISYLPPRRMFSNFLVFFVYPVLYTPHTVFWFLCLFYSWLYLTTEIIHFLPWRPNQKYIHTRLIYEIKGMALRDLKGFSKRLII